MKKILSLCLVFSMMFAAITGISAHASGAAVSVGNASAKAGGSFSVQVNLSGNSGFANLGIEIEYDANAMTLLSATGNSNVGAIFTAAQNTDVTPYNMGWDNTSNITYNGTLATLNFAVKDNAVSGNYPIKVNYYKGRNGDYTDGEDVNYDENFESLNLTYTSGSVTVCGGGSIVTPPPQPSEPTGVFVKLGYVQGKAGGTVEVPVIIANNTGFANLGIEVEYDTSVFTLLSATGNSDVGAIFTTAQNTTVIPYNIGWDSTSNIAFNGTLATLNFTVKDSASTGNYPIKVSYYKGRNGDYTDGEDVNYDENFEPLNLSYVNGNITVSDGSSAPTIKDSISPVSAHYYAAANKIEVDAYLPKDSASYDGKVIVAMYDDNKKLVAVQVKDAAYSNHFEFSNMTSNCMAKVMWWDNLKSLRPLAYAKTVVADE